MDGTTHSNWFDDPSLVCQFPWLYRQYARYCRLVVDRRSGLIRGGTALFALLGAIHSGLGCDYACGLTCDSSKLFLDLTDDRMLQVLGESLQDSGERRILQKLLKPGDTFVDIGANHGSFSLLAARLVGRAGLVVAFEPQERLSLLVERSLGETGACDFEVFNAGCSNRAGTVEFYVPKHSSGSAGLFKGFSGAQRHRKFNVKLTTVDDCFAEIPIRQSLFFKIDVEGSEFDVLQGARETIQRHMPPLLLEVNPASARAAGHSIEELFGLLLKMGYEDVCEIDEYPSTKSILQVNTEAQRNLLVLHGEHKPGVVRQ